MKATNEELRAALEACAEAYETCIGDTSAVSLEIRDSAKSARALLDRKSCEDCEFGTCFSDGLLCIWKLDHGPAYLRTPTPFVLGHDYANKCDCYKEKVPK